MKSRNEPAQKVTAADLQKLLAARHAEDVYVPECKNGPTHGERHLRLDGWAMRKSWSNPLVTGYEIKVSRADFLQDDKWRGYLPMCNCLYFVAPSGIISEKEVPPECGLIVLAANGTKLLQKRKAPWRDVVIPEALFRYLLMCRARFGEEHDFERMLSQESNATFWKQWLADRRWNQEVGYRVRKALGQEIRRIRDENDQLREKAEGIDRALKVLSSMGVSSWDLLENRVEESIARKFAALGKIELGPLKRLAGNMIRDLDNFRKSIERVELEGVGK